MPDEFEEEYAEWLGRLEEEESLPDEITEFRDVLSSELYGFSDKQINALWRAKGAEVSYEEHSIRAVTVRYPWGSEVRYGVQGMSGLWGWETVQNIREGEGW